MGLLTTLVRPGLSRRRQPRRHTRRRGLTVLFVIGALALATSALRMTAPKHTAPDAPAPAAHLELSSFEATMAANLIPDEASRPVYRYSVVKGGAYNPDEMAAAIEKDPVVAAHYLGLDPDTLRVERVTAPRWEYMSYRIGDDVFWTKNKIQLHVGETLLTDGNTTIRARCGNCIASAPRGPASDEEPGNSAFTTREDDNLGLGEPDLQAALLPDVPPELIGVGNSRPVTMFGPGDITLLAPGTETQSASGGSGGSSVPMFVPFGGGGGGSNGPDEPGNPGQPGGPENPGNPGGPENPGNPGGPENPGNPGNPGGPETRGNPGGPEEPPFNPPSDDSPGGPVSVPEPGTLLLMAVGGAGMLVKRLRQRS